MIIQYQTKMFIVFFLFLITISSTTTSSNLIIVTDYNAVGDGIADDSQAFENAWDALCTSTEPTPILQIPEGKTFLIKQVNFTGPCRSSNIEIQILGNIIAPADIDWVACTAECWLCFDHIDGLTLRGHGTINGNANLRTWWKDGGTHTSLGCKKPAVLHFNKCDDLQVNNVTSKDSPLNHMSISSCDGVSISHVSLVAPEDSPNTDGIDISNSHGINISDSFIGTGDDCIAINSGTSVVNIVRLFCGPGHGISIGSLGKDGSNDTVEEIHVRNCTFKGTDNGARIKTWPRGSGFARSISFDDIILEKSEHPIIIDQHYCPHIPNCPSDAVIAVAISDIAFTGFRGSCEGKDAITLNCSSVIHCRDITMSNINISPAESTDTVIAKCQNAYVLTNNTTPKINCN